MSEGGDAAQRQIDTRAIELAQKALTAQEYHEREDELRFKTQGAQIEAVAEGLAKLGDKMEKDKGEIIGAIQTLRSDESGKRKAIYDNWDRYRDRIIVVLIGLALGIGGYAFHLATGK